MSNEQPPQEMEEDTEANLAVNTSNTTESDQSTATNDSILSAENDKDSCDFNENPESRTLFVGKLRIACMNCERNIPFHVN